jgi:hypothetical protein
LRRIALSVSTGVEADEAEATGEDAGSAGASLAGTASGCETACEGEEASVE